MVYFVDTRPEPDLCFAYLWQAQNHTLTSEADVGGPALTWVPCEAVENILYNKPIPK